MEALLTRNALKGIRPQLEISYLFFVDDLILFTKANEEGSVAIKEVLDLFCSESGQKLSSTKSRIYFSQNVEASPKSKICENLNI